MTFTVENLEFYLLVLVRVSALVMTAPFFSYRKDLPMQPGQLFWLLLLLLMWYRCNMREWLGTLY